MGRYAGNALERHLLCILGFSVVFHVESARFTYFIPDRRSIHIIAKMPDYSKIYKVHKRTQALIACNSRYTAELQAITRQANGL